MINSLILKIDSKVRFTIMIGMIVFAVFYLTQPLVRNEDRDYLKKVDFLKDATIMIDDKVVADALPYVHNLHEPFEVYFSMNNYRDKDYNGKKAIGISTSYVNFDVYLGDKEIHRYEDDNTKILGSGGGTVFTIVDLPQNVNDDELKIVFTPNIHVQNYLIEPVIFADRSNIVLFTMSEDYPSLILVCLLFFLFLVILVIYLASYKSQNYRKRLLGISLSSFVIGIYVFANLNISAYMLSEYRGLLYFMEYSSLMFFPYPLIKFIEDDLNLVMRRILKVCSIVLFTNFFVQFFFVSMNILEFREMLLITHMIIMVVFVNLALSIVFSEFEKKNEKWIILLSIAPAYLSMGIIYFRNSFSNNAFFIRLFALTMIIFVIVQLYTFIKDYIDMSKENMHLKVYEKMTSIDALTGLNNRYAFNNAIEEIKSNPVKVTVISVDLNNLKVINDTMGHACGDRAIIEVGNYLKDNIPNSQIFRIGGDEFLVLSKDILDEEEISRLNLKEIYIEEVSEMVDITFSIGMCIYDMENVQSIDEAIIVSDMRMYENKERLRKQRKNRYIFTRL